MIDLAQRLRTDEQMDDPALDDATYAAVLADLARVNRWTLAGRPTLGFLARAARDMPAFRLLDVGFGQGDMLRRIARWARRRGIAVDLVGVDLNAASVGVARAATPIGMPIEYRAGDYEAQPTPFDFVVSSLVAHHMTDEELTAFIRYMERMGTRGWLINDLHRHRFAYLGFPLLARLLGAHRIVREDGQLSIARAFRPAEWRDILAQAGVPADAARIVRRFPFRLCVERLR
ncbi:MAG: methyltransferase domain-containing protein [Sphingomonas sp.]|nr:methyltransferase domain-containing protein [Sphingomonas sp.]